jgi:hypothetical protein
VNPTVLIVRTGIHVHKYRCKRTKREGELAQHVTRPVRDLPVRVVNRRSRGASVGVRAAVVGRHDNRRNAEREKHNNVWFKRACNLFVSATIVMRAIGGGGISRSV